MQKSLSDRLEKVNSSDQRRKSSAPSRSGFDPDALRIDLDSDSECSAEAEDSADLPVER